LSHPSLIMIVLTVALALGLPTANRLSQAVITLHPDTTYQTITGWEAVAQAGHEDSPAFPVYADSLFDLAANDLGINRIRLEVRSGAEHSKDLWSETRAGQLDRATIRCIRYSTVNDDDDPFHINWNGFHFAELDHALENVVLPMKQQLERRGETLFLNLTYVAFTRHMAQPGCSPDLKYHHQNPEEYAEFVLATYLHLRDKYGVVPDAWNVMLEPDNTDFWRGEQIGRAIVAAGNRLKAHGFTPSFIAPSTTNMSTAISYFDGMARVPGALAFLSELSYHRYDGVSDAALEQLGRRSVQSGVQTSMLEHMGSGYQDLHKDLKIGRVSAWQQFALAYPGTPGKDNGGAYYLIFDTDKATPKISLSNTARFLRQYFRYIRSGAVRIDAKTNDGNFDPVAFINTAGDQVVVVQAKAAGSLSIEGLPPGTYGRTYTTGSRADVDAGDVSIGPGAALTATIPDAGVITIFAKGPTSAPPVPAATAVPAATPTQVVASIPATAVPAPVAARAQPTAVPAPVAARAQATAAPTSVVAQVQATAMPTPVVAPSQVTSAPVAPTVSARSLFPAMVLRRVCRQFWAACDFTPNRVPSVLIATNGPMAGVSVLLAR
jgi:hypothetical protein